MNEYFFVVLFCTVTAMNAGPFQFVWLRDMNNDADKRHLEQGLSKELRFHLNGGGKSINLHLQEYPYVRADADMYVVNELPDGTKRAVKEPFTGNIESKYYHDIENGAAFSVRCIKKLEGPCSRTLEGSLRIGDQYFHIAPVFDRTNYLNREYNDTPHVMQEEKAIGENIRLTNDTILPSDAEEEYIKKSFFVNVEKDDFNKNKRQKEKFGIELLVAVDPPVWEKFLALADNNTQNAMRRVREYVSHVINGVALTYKTIQDRTFTIDITLKAIAVIKKEEDGPYQIAKPFKKNGQWFIQDGQYLDGFVNWLANTPGIPRRSEFDHAMMLTGYTLAKSTGVAYMSAVCTQRSISLVTEEGYFNTLMVASHELAHGLGADHDSDVGCSQGNIMWMNLPGLQTNYTHRSWEFSKCSKDDFEKLLSGRSCVKDEATFYDKEEYDNFMKVLLGQIYNPDEQCKIAFGKDSYRCGIPAPNKICVSLRCYNPKLGSCERQVAADGTECGTGKQWCFEGQCVSKPSGITTTVKPSTPTAKGRNGPSTSAPPCQNLEMCPMLLEVYDSKKEFCSDLGKVCCELCKDQGKCENTGYMDLSCAKLRQRFQSKEKFCAKWSKNCCVSCSKNVAG